ncbi:fasciclin-like arabinogalactan protein 8 [Phoenix dactylifera]|uniref:Fasciclin-like arabinogalactan protein 8 n=1 Tax=Phoenix dactylifera TaxID=42345 RepID=A0A8B8ZPG4_PHODC|nr:fasciclin-like arabinogalactan protein 8 [Phoenix dactylifera]
MDRRAVPGLAYGSKLDSYTKTVREVPYNLSVLEISAPIIFPGLLAAPSAASSNLTALLEKAGCKTFASLLASSGVLKIFQSAMDKGLTLFAPNDEAFKASGVPDLHSLSSAELVTLLQYHALLTYTPKSSLKTAKGRIATMASTGTGRYDFSVVSRGDDVSLDTSRVASTASVHWFRPLWAVPGWPAGRAVLGLRIVPAQALMGRAGLGPRARNS